MSKKTLTLEAIEGQTALELPQRETLLLTIVINNVLNDLTINANVQACVLCSGVTFGDVNFGGGGTGGA